MPRGAARPLPVRTAPGRQLDTAAPLPGQPAAPRMLFRPFPRKCWSRERFSPNHGLVSPRCQNCPGRRVLERQGYCGQTQTREKVRFRKVLTKEETMVKAEPRGVAESGGRSTQRPRQRGRRPAPRDRAFAGLRRAAPHPLGRCFPVPGSGSGASVWTVGTPRWDVTPAPCTHKADRWKRRYVTRYVRRLVRVARTVQGPPNAPHSPWPTFHAPPGAAAHGVARTHLPAGLPPHHAAAPPALVSRGPALRVSPDLAFSCSLRVFVRLYPSVRP